MKIILLKLFNIGEFELSQSNGYLMDAGVASAVILAVLGSIAAMWWMDKIQDADRETQ